jgi:putative transposase
VARRGEDSRRRRKAIQHLRRAHAHVRNQRADFHHKESRKLVNGYGLIAVEDLNVKGLARGMLAGSVNDAGWSSFIAKPTYKAESAGRVLVKVEPRGTSQRCICGHAVPKTLSERTHRCPKCGLTVGRDHAAALEILRLGLSLQSVTCSTG